MMSVIKRSAREAGVAALLDDRRSGVPVGKRQFMEVFAWLTFGRR